MNMQAQAMRDLTISYDNSTEVINFLIERASELDADCAKFSEHSCALHRENDKMVEELKEIKWDLRHEESENFILRRDLKESEENAEFLLNNITDLIKRLKGILNKEFKREELVEIVKFYELQLEIYPDGIERESIPDERY